MELNQQQLAMLDRARRLGDQLRAEVEGRTFTARDGTDLVEVSVGADGELVEVAVNEPAATRSDLTSLAAAFLRATNNAREKATHETRQRRLDVFRHGV